MIQSYNDTLIKINLNFRNKVPLSDQLQNEIRQLILNNVLQPGDLLPTVRGLAAQLNVNFNTVARAYRMLDQEGWVYTHQGRGTQVAERTEISTETIQQAKEEYLKSLVDQMLDLAAQAELSIYDLSSEIAKRLSEAQKKQAHKNRARVITRKKRTNRHQKQLTQTAVPDRSQPAHYARKAHLVRKARQR